MEILPAVAVCIIKCFTNDGGSSSKDELCESAFAKVSKLVHWVRGFFNLCEMGILMHVQRECNLRFFLVLAACVFISPSCY